MTTPRDFVTVDMRGLKAPLEARARETRRSVSALVREAVSDAYALHVRRAAEPVAATRTTSSCETVKISIRVTRTELATLDSRVGKVAPSRAAVLAGLLAGVPALRYEGGADRLLAGLIASNAELATLSRHVTQLCALLERGNGVAARAYLQRLEGLSEQVRSHLKLSGCLLVELRAGRAPTTRVKEARA